VRRLALPPARLLAVVAPVSLVGVAAYVAATLAFALSPGNVRTVAGAAAFLVASTLAERFPVPVEGADANGVSLGFVFAVAALVLFGWAPATIVYATAPTIVALLARKPAIRTIFNAGVFGLVGSLAALLLTRLHGETPLDSVAKVAATGAVLYAANLLLVSAAIAASGQGTSYIGVIRSNVRWTLLPFVIMGSTALMLVILWQRSPYLVASLVGPLIAISLYQRTTHTALSAMRLALTDPLTGLGNHRHFHERLQRELTLAEQAGGIVSLCLLDIDDFKRINDRFGHPAGDRVLAQVASRMRQGGEAFRLGGDEFAVLLPAFDEDQALGVAQAIVERISVSNMGLAGTINVSAGVATYPHHSTERESLIRLADGALYWAKEHGKNQVRLARSNVAELADFRRVATTETVDPAARSVAASSLARVVDGRDIYVGSHSQRVAGLAAELALRLGLPAQKVELVRLAGDLHDVGKLAIPAELLRKQDGLTTSERRVVERHPQIGYRMLQSLGIEAVARWVLHHHEHWDGTGYPDGLAGEQIPLGSRIVHIAEALDAMTSCDRLYRRPLSAEEADRELERGSGTLFDPHLVDLLLFQSTERQELVGI